MHSALTNQMGTPVFALEATGRCIWWRKCQECTSFPPTPDILQSSALGCEDSLLPHRGEVSKTVTRLNNLAILRLVGCFCGIKRVYLSFAVFIPCQGLAAWLESVYTASGSSQQLLQDFPASSLRYSGLHSGGGPALYRNRDTEIGAEIGRGSKLQ